MGDRWYDHPTAQNHPRLRKNTEDFGFTSERLRKAGFVVMPVNGKSPCIRGWNGFWLQLPSSATYAQWRKKYPTLNVGLCLGEVVAVDIDFDILSRAEETQALVFKLLGATDFIRVGRSPRRTLFYRVPWETAQSIDGWKVPSVEFLAQTEQSVVYGIHPDTKQPFKWPKRSLLEAKQGDLPLVDPACVSALKEALQPPEPSSHEGQEISHFDLGYSPIVGERDRYLFWYAKESAAATHSLAELEQLVRTRNSQFDAPLPDAQAVQKARSAWRLKLTDRLMLRGHNKRPLLAVASTRLAELIPYLKPLAAKVYLALCATRPKNKPFTVTQKATAEALRMSKASLQSALKSLIKSGLLIDTGKRRGGSQNWRGAKLYRFGSGWRSQDQM